MSNCPVCDNPYNMESEVYDSGALSETQLKCGKCDYSYEYSYGSYRVTVQGEVFEWGYSYPYRQARLANEAVNRARAALHSV